MDEIREREVETVEEVERVEEVNANRRVWERV